MKTDGDPENDNYVTETPPNNGRGWRWSSTPESANALQVSILAVFETLLAIGIYAWIAVHFGTLHLLVAACVTPFVLLRTPVSTDLGLKLVH